MNITAYIRTYGFNCYFRILGNSKMKFGQISFYMTNILNLFLALL